MTRRSPDAEPIGPDGRPLSEQPTWRRDFPVDVAEDNYVSRRDFTKFLVLTSGAFVVGQAVIGARSLFDAPPPTAVAIAKVADLPVGAARAFAYPAPADIALLVRVDQETLVAFDQRCTHLSCAVVPEPDRKRFFCPCHEGSFDLETGRPIGGPPRRPLRRITIEVRDGVVYAMGVEARLQ
jgi:Rieske Fe-S protein